MNTCKACRHARRPLLTDWPSAQCDHPTAVTVNPVSGENQRRYCIVQRGLGGCGEAGIDFSPAPLHRRVLNACRGAFGSGLITIILLVIAANVRIIANGYIDYLKGLTP